jgi:hypothetical protein
VTPDQIKALCQAAGGQQATARLLQVDPRNVRRWCAGESHPPHAAIELLWQHLAGLWPTLIWRTADLRLPPGWEIWPPLAGQQSAPDPWRLEHRPTAAITRHQTHWSAAQAAWEGHLGFTRQPPPAADDQPAAE